MILIEDNLPSFDIAEIGVWKGGTFQHLVRFAEFMGVHAHAFDSFEGMAEPTEDDKDKNGCGYPKGRLNVGGKEAFMRSMEAFGIDSSRYKIHVGFVPDCFESAGKLQRFSLVRIDLDHYKPTVIAAEWAWERLVPDGVLRFHDYFPEKNALASKAIKEFLVKHQKEIPNSALCVNGIELTIKKEKS